MNAEMNSGDQHGVSSTDMWNPTNFNMVHWVDRLIDQLSDGPSIILIDRKKPGAVGCWLGLVGLKTLYLYFYKGIKK